MPQGWLITADAAERLGVSVSTVHLLHAASKLEGKRQGRGYVFTEESVAAVAELRSRWVSQATAGELIGASSQHPRPRRGPGRTAPVRDDAIASTVMLGLPGFKVLAVSEYAGEVEQAVETTATEGWCPGCGCRPGCTTGARHG